jgi:hypothetical protein
VSLNLIPQIVGIGPNVKNLLADSVTYILASVLNHLRSARLLICQPFALDAAQRSLGTFTICHLALIVPEIELGKVAMQMAPAARLFMPRRSTWRWEANGELPPIRLPAYKNYYPLELRAAAIGPPGGA